MGFPEELVVTDRNAGIRPKRTETAWPGLNQGHGSQLTRCSSSIRHIEKLPY